MTRGRRLTHLCLHGIGDPPSGTDPAAARYWISEALLLQVLDLVAGRPDVTVSVDDGNASDVHVVLPALVDRGMTASFFPVVDWLGTPGFLTRDEVVALTAAGMSVGVHGLTHRPWRACPPHLLHDELAVARTVLEELTGGPVDTAACPLGAYDAKALRELTAQGFSTVYTSDRATAVQGTWLQPRFSLTDQDTLDSVRAWLTPPGRVRRTKDAARIRVKRLR